MAGAMTVSTTKELYPPARVTEVDTILRAVSTKDRSRDAKMVLRRELTPPERSALRGRSDALAPWCDAGIYPGRNAVRIAAVTARCLNGFGRRSESEEDAATVAAQFGDALKDLPPWAVERAFMRFASGDVKPEEIGEKQQINLQYGPSTAQVGALARKICEGVRAERRLISLALSGRVDPATIERTPEMQEKVDQQIDAVTNSVRMAAAQTRLDEVARLRRSDELNDRRKSESLKRILDGYRARGLPVPEVPPHGIVQSVDFLLAGGYTIEEVGGGSAVLVAPVRPLFIGCEKCGRSEGQNGFTFDLCRMGGCPKRGAA